MTVRVVVTEVVKSFFLGLCLLGSRVLCLAVAVTVSSTTIGASLLPATAAAVSSLSHKAREVVLSWTRPLAHEGAVAALLLEFSLRSVSIFLLLDRFGGCSCCCCEKAVISKTTASVSAETPLQLSISSSSSVFTRRGPVMVSRGGAMLRFALLFAVRGYACTCPAGRMRPPLGLPTTGSGTCFKGTCCISWTNCRVAEAKGCSGG